MRAALLRASSGSVAEPVPHFGQRAANQPFAQDTADLGQLAARQRALEFERQRAHCRGAQVQHHQRALLIERLEIERDQRLAIERAGVRESHQARERGEQRARLHPAVPGRRVTERGSGGAGSPPAARPAARSGSSRRARSTRSRWRLGTRPASLRHAPAGPRPRARRGRHAPRRPTNATAGIARERLRADRTRGAAVEGHQRGENAAQPAATGRDRIRLRWPGTAGWNMARSLWVRAGECQIALDALGMRSRGPGSTRSLRRRRSAPTPERGYALRRSLEPARLRPRDRARRRSASRTARPVRGRMIGADRAHFRASGPAAAISAAIDASDSRSRSDSGSRPASSSAAQRGNA